MKEEPTEEVEDEAKRNGDDNAKGEEERKKIPIPVFFEIPYPWRDEPFVRNIIRLYKNLKEYKTRCKELEEELKTAKSSTSGGDSRAEEYERLLFAAEETLREKEEMCRVAKKEKMEVERRLSEVMHESKEDEMMIERLREDRNRLKEELKEREEEVNALTISKSTLRYIIKKERKEWREEKEKMSKRIAKLACEKEEKSLGMKHMGDQLEMSIRAGNEKVAKTRIEMEEEKAREVEAIRRQLSHFAEENAYLRANMIKKDEEMVETLNTFEEKEIQWQANAKKDHERIAELEKNMKRLEDVKAIILAMGTGGVDAAAKSQDEQLEGNLIEREDNEKEEEMGEKKSRKRKAEGIIEEEEDTKIPTTVSASSNSVSPQIPLHPERNNYGSSIDSRRDLTDFRMD